MYQCIAAILYSILLFLLAIQCTGTMYLVHTKRKQIKNVLKHQLNYVKNVFSNNIKTLPVDNDDSILSYWYLNYARQQVLTCAKKTFNITIWC